MTNELAPKRNVDWLARKANEMRISILQTVVRAGGGHIGGAFSIIDVMTALYFRVLCHDPKNPAWPERDRLIFSKGHGCLALYAVLAETGYFGKERLESFCEDGGQLAGHPERDFVPGVEITSGSLGHGLPIAVGTALAARMDKQDHHTFVVLSDGECNEGSVWEAVMAATRFELDSLTMIIDSNKYGSLGQVSEFMHLEPLVEKLRAFGFSAHEVDGHSMIEIVEVLEKAPLVRGKPNAIVAHTVKGKGVSYMENVTKWHYRAPNEQEAAIALSELEEASAA